MEDRRRGERTERNRPPRAPSQGSDQAQRALEQAFELQLNAARAAMSALEMQETALRGGTVLPTKAFRQYLWQLDAIQPAAEGAVETGMRAAGEGGPIGQGGPPERRSAPPGPGQQREPGGAGASDRPVGRTEYADREPPRAPSGPPRGGRAETGSAHGTRAEQNRYQPPTEGFGQEQQWMPHPQSQGGSRTARSERTDEAGRTGGRERSRERIDRGRAGDPDWPRERGRPEERERAGARADERDRGPAVQREREPPRPPATGPAGEPERGRERPAPSRSGPGRDVASASAGRAEEPPGTAGGRFDDDRSYEHPVPSRDTEVGPDESVREDRREEAVREDRGEGDEFGRDERGEREESDAAEGREPIETGRGVELEAEDEDESGDRLGAEPAGPDRDRSAAEGSIDEAGDAERERAGAEPVGPERERESEEPIADESAPSEAAPDEAVDEREPVSDAAAAGEVVPAEDTAEGDTAGKPAAEEGEVADETEDESDQGEAKSSWSLLNRFFR